MQEWESVPEIAALAGSAGVGVELPTKDGNDTASYEHGKIFDIYEHGKIFDTADLCYRNTI